MIRSTTSHQYPSKLTILGPAEPHLLARKREMRQIHIDRFHLMCEIWIGAVADADAEDDEEAVAVAVAEEAVAVAEEAVAVAEEADEEAVAEAETETEFECMHTMSIVRRMMTRN